jgi:hypothetical protein
MSSVKRAKFLVTACLILIAAAVSASPALADAKRVALVIGNNDYENVPKLQKAVNDADAVAAELSKLGFDVVKAENVGQKAMSRAVNELETKIGSGDTVLFYFAGHGFAVDGTNYLLPVDVPEAGPGEEGIVRDASFAATGLSDRLQQKGAGTVILILDACRDNPFALKGGRSIGLTRGLSRMDPTEGMFVLFSAGQGQSALDRLSETDSNPNSVFTRTLLTEMAAPGQSMVQIAKKTQSKVRELAAKVDHVQVPAYYDQIVGDLYLVPGGAANGAAGTIASLEEGGDAGVLAARELHALEQRLDGQRLIAGGGDAIRLSRRRARRVHRRRPARCARSAHRAAHAEDLFRAAAGSGQDQTLCHLARQTRRAGRRVPDQFRPVRRACQRAEENSGRAVDGLGFVPRF